MDNRLLTQVEITKLSEKKPQSVTENAGESLGMQHSVTVIAGENGCALHQKHAVMTGLYGILTMIGITIE